MSTLPAAVEAAPSPVDAVTLQERYVLAVTIASAGADPSEADYAAWDRVREIAAQAGLTVLPPLLPDGLRWVLRVALLGSDGVLAGWEPNTLDDALHLAARAGPSVLATLVACLAGSGSATSGLAPDSDTVRAAQLTAGMWNDAKSVTEAERAFARLLLPDLAHAIVDGGALV